MTRPLTRAYEAVMFEDQEVTSKEIERLRKKSEELVASIATVKEQRAEEEKLLEQLEAEFGGEISRIKKEFARMKERAIEESVEISNTAKSDLLVAAKGICCARVFIGFISYNNLWNFALN